MKAKPAAELHTCCCGANCVVVFSSSGNVAKAKSLEQLRLHERTCAISHFAPEPPTSEEVECVAGTHVGEDAQLSSTLVGSKTKLVALPSQACSVCSKPGHDERTCPHASSGSEAKPKPKACSCEDGKLNDVKSRGGLTLGTTAPGQNIFASGTGVPRLDGRSMRLTSAVAQRVPADADGATTCRVHGTDSCSPVEVCQLAWDRSKGPGCQQPAQVSPFEAKLLLDKHAAGTDDPRVNGLAAQFWRGEFEMFLGIHPCTNWVLGNVALFLAFLLSKNEQCSTATDFDPAAWSLFQIHLGTPAGVLHMQQAHREALAGANTTTGALSVTQSLGFARMDAPKRNALWTHCAAKLALGHDASKQLSSKFMGSCFEQLVGIKLPHQKPGDGAAPPGAHELSKRDFALLFVELLGEGLHWHFHPTKGNRSVLAIAGLTNAGNVAEVNGKLAFKNGHDACSDETATLQVANMEHGNSHGWGNFKKKKQHSCTG